MVFILLATFLVCFSKSLCVALGTVHIWHQQLFPDFLTSHPHSLMSQCFFYQRFANFSELSCRFLNSNYISKLNSNCSGRTSGTSKKSILFQKLFWTVTIWINCSSDLKKFTNKSFSWSLEPIFSHSMSDQFWRQNTSFLWMHSRKKPKHFFSLDKFFF